MRDKSFRFLFGDYIFILIVLLLAAALTSKIFLFSSPAKTAELVVDGEILLSYNLETGEINYENPNAANITEEYSYSNKNDVLSVIIKNNGYHLKLEFIKGKAYFVKADCPDKVCVQTGRISIFGQIAACVPASVLIKITGDDSEDNPDVIIG